MKVLTFASDSGGCRAYRVRMPNIELKRFGVESLEMSFIPNQIGVDPFHTVANIIYQYDLVIIQRCYIYDLVKTIIDACKFVGIPLIFETDDDYLNLPPDNPAYMSIIPQHILDTLVNPDGKTLDTERVLYERWKALEDYKKILREVDGVTVSTEELKQTLLPYNKNIKVLPNCVPFVYPGRDHSPAESMMDQNGNIHIKNNQGMVSVPSHYFTEKGAVEIPRIGYTLSLSHRGKDWDTIKTYWEKLVKKYSTTKLPGGVHTHGWYWVYVGCDPGELGNFIGDPSQNIFPRDYWLREHYNICKTDRQPWRVAPIGPSEYDLYLYHLRNIDVGIAALHMEGIFNQAKSDIKLKEYAMWGIPGVAPNYITYNRTFKHGETALLYNNGREFMEYVELLANDRQLRMEIGAKAQQMVEQSFLAKDWAEERFNFYKSLVEKAYRLEVFAE